MKVLTFLAAAALGFALVPAAQAAVAAYPSSQTIMPSGPLPPDGGTKLVLNTARYETEDGLIVVAGARSVSVALDASGLAPLGVQLLWGHYVSFGAKSVPDALLPWDGSAKSSERPNQPIWIQVTVPPEAKPGVYAASIAVTADGKVTTVPLSVKVFNVMLPAPGTAIGNLLTSFNVTPEAYLNTVDSLYGLKAGWRFLAANQLLFGFLSRYRITPSSWGYGDPKVATGYTTSPKWWLNAADAMTSLMSGTQGFAAMWVPISNNRWSPHDYVGGLSPYEPERWCGYLGAVRSFWVDRGWLTTNVPYVFGMDEPGLSGEKVVARQAAVVHRCFPGAKVLMTGNPSPKGVTDFLLKGDSRLDIWAVLGNRFYGEFTVPKQQKAGTSRARVKYDAIQKARAAGSQIWSYNYAGTGTPGFLATEPLSDPRMFMLWNALEGLQGVLYNEGLAVYRGGNPFTAVDRDGAYVLLYPGPSGPIPSARLEQIRDGIEDWAIYNMIRVRKGLGAVRAILGGAGLFSADSSGVKLACTVGCQLKGSQPFSWPLWSQDATTPRRIEAAKLAALQAAS